MEPYIYLLIAIAGEVVGTSALKASYGMTKLMPSVLVIMGYMITLWTLSITLKTIPIGVAYAIWCGLGIVSIALIGIFFFEEDFTFYHFLGMALILGGVLILTLLTSLEAEG